MATEPASAFCICLTGAESSGKSTLVIETLYKALCQHLNHARVVAGPHSAVVGLEHIDKVIDTLKAIAKEEDNVVDEPAPRVRIRGFGDNSIDLELLCWIRRPAERGIVVHRLNRDIIHRFREEQIEIPFPQRVVNMQS